MVMATVAVGLLRKGRLSLRQHSYNTATVTVTVEDHRLHRPWLPRRNLPHSRATVTDRADRLKGSLKGRRKEKSNDDDEEITHSICGSPVPDRSRLQGQCWIRDVGLDVG